MSDTNTLKKVTGKKALDGILLINKPVGKTSNGVLQHIKRGYGVKKAGHTGTLDPFANGLLIACFGHATKISGLLLDADKGYRATLKLGVKTTTADLEGEVLEESSIPELSAAEIRSVLESFLGPGKQIPPMYSALKQGGKRLYELAREGKTVARQARDIVVRNIQLLSCDEQEICFEIICSKGTYVRTLGEDIAHKLGTVGHLSALERTQIGHFHVENAKSPDQLASEGWPESFLLGSDQALLHWPACELSENEAQRFCHGQLIAPQSMQQDLAAQLTSTPANSPVNLRVYGPNKAFLGHGEWLLTRQLKPRRLFVNTNKG